MPKRVLTEMSKPKFEEILDFAKAIPESEKISDQIEAKYGKRRMQLFGHLLHKFDQGRNTNRFRKALLWDDETVECSFHPVYRK